MRSFRFFAFRFSWLVVGLTVGLLWLGQVDRASAQALAGQPVGDNLASESLLPDVPMNLSGESLFSLNCAGCHAHGGNIIRRGKNLQQKTLVRRGYGEAGAIAQIITQGKGAMPAYADRLTTEEIEAIATYVLQQAEAGW